MIVCDSRLELEAQVVRPLQQLAVRRRRDAVLRRLIQIPEFAAYEIKYPNADIVGTIL